MQTPTLIPPDPTTDPVYLTAAAMSSLIQTLPSGTAYGIGVVLIVMMTGRLMQYKGSLARAVLPFVVHLQWGWHRVDRAMERGKVQRDAVFDGAFQWCSDQLDVAVVRLGELEREVISLDSSTIVRLRCQVGKSDLLGTGYGHRAGRAVRGNIVAAAVSIILIRGVRVGVVRRVRFGVSCEAAVATRCTALSCIQGGVPPRSRRMRNSRVPEQRARSGCDAGSTGIMQDTSRPSGTCCGWTIRPMNTPCYLGRRHKS